MKEQSVYVIHHFPGSNPNPTKSRWLWLAKTIGLFQRGIGIGELRIICEAGPNKGKHYVL